MKRGLLIIFLASAVLLSALQGCKGGGKIEPDPPVEEPLLIDTTIVVPATGGINRFTVISHSKWKISVVSGAAWCHVTPTDGGSGGATIAVKSDPNDEFAVRQALVRIDNATTHGTISVIQQQIDVLDLTVDDECEFGPQGGNFAAKLDYNIDYTVTCSADWVRQVPTKAPLHADLLFEVDKNNYGADRQCEVTIAGGGFSHTVTVSQIAAYITLSIDDVALEASVTRLPVMVESNVSYVSSLPEDCPWLSIAGETAGGTDGQKTTMMFDLDLEENEGWFLREGTVSFGNPDYNLSGSIHILHKAVDIMYASLPLFEFGPEGGSFEFDTDPTKEYKFTADGADWIKVSTVEDNPSRRIITVDKSLSGEGRTASVTINRGNTKKTLDFYQAGVAPEFSATELRFATAGGSQTLGVSGSVEYTLVPPEDAPWCTIEPAEDGGYTVTVAANDTEQPRSCRIGFVNKEYEVSETVTVIQAQKDAFEVTPNAFSFGPEGGTAAVDIHTNIEFTCETDSPGWISGDAGSGSGLREFAVALNDSGRERQGRLIFTADGFEKVVSIEQQAAYIIAPEHDIAFDDKPYEGSFEVSSNVPFQTRLLGEGWCSINVSGSTVSFAAAENNEWGNRSAEIVLYNSEYKAADTVSVHQGAKYYLDIKQMEFDLTPAGGTVALEVSSNKEYTYFIEGSPGWISEVSPLVFEVAPNLDSQARDVKIVFEQNGKSKSVSIWQDAPALVVNPLSFEFAAAGGEGTFSVTGNIGFTVSQPAEEWVQCTGTASSYTITVAQNPEPEMRSCTIEISSSEFERSVTIEVIQAAKGIFELLTDSFSLGPEGGEIAIEVNTNVDYTSSSTVEWISGEGLSYAVAPNDSGEDRSGTIEFMADGYTYSVAVTQTAAVINVDTDHLEFPVGGGTLSFSVTSNVEYELYVPEEDWISCTSAGDGLFEVTAPANETELRECTISVVSPDYGISVEVSLRQDRTEFFDLLTEAFEVEPEGGEIVVELNTNAVYEVSLPNNWIVAEGNLKYKVKENQTGVTRQGHIVFETAGQVYTVTVTQASLPIPFSLKQKEYFVGPCGGELEVVHTVCQDVEVSIYGSNWIIELPSRRQDTLLVFKLDTLFVNSTREAVASIVGDGRSQAAYIFQNPPLLVLGEESKTFKSGGGQTSIQVVSNFTPKFYTDADWLHGTFDEDGTRLTIVADKNNTGEERTVVVEVGLKEISALKTVTITQEPNAILRVSPEEINADGEGGESFLTVEANTEYFIEPLASWLKCERTEDETVLKVTVAANPSIDSRASSIIFSGSGENVSVRVNQAGNRNPDYYYSEDYSQNGKSEKIQTATVGSGIPLVLMGDAFTDRLIEDGTYKLWLDKAVEALFAIEPYKSFRNMFNIWYITLVSANEVYADDAVTALSTKFTGGSVVSGDNNAVMTKANALYSPVEAKNALMVVLMNARVYGGTTYLYNYLGPWESPNWGEGPSVAYIPLCTNDEEFEQVIKHEVGGHGFGKLEDEYFYQAYETIPQERIEQYATYQQGGFYTNVDFTSDPEQIRWAHFLSDERYQYDGVGIFEGAAMYRKGIYRPSEDGMMRHNTGQFNAPSREFIYYRLHKVAYGKSWGYRREEFIEYDAINRRTSPGASQGSLRGTPSSEDNLPPLPHPVMICIE